MTHCIVCGVLDSVGECVVCEDCAEKQSERRKCIYLDTSTGKNDIPAQRPLAYCYAYGISECPSGLWEITEKCWKGGE